MFGLPLELLLATVVLKAVSASLVSLEVDDWASAFYGAVVISLVGFGATMAGPFVLHPSPDQLWRSIAFSGAVSLIGLLIAAVAVPGLRIRGLAGPVVAVILLTFVGFGLSMLIMELARTGSDQSPLRIL
ncbi:MAG TPA: hypothetical protein VFO19_16290 [Vicinamibacterales bacterium]|nr:hypothetical protein [Vicinamibacterales bacterium]